MKKNGDLRGTAQLIALALAICALAFALSKTTGGDAAGSPIIITEIMTRNEGAWPTGGGEALEWVELTNASDERVELSGFKLSVGKDLRGAVALTGALEPGQRIVLTCSGTSANADIPHSLSRGGSLVALLDGAGKLLESVVTPAMAQGESYALIDGKWTITGDYTPGLENTEENHEQLIRPEREGGVRITEVMANEISESASESRDWVELYNSTGDEVDLSLWHLSDDARALYKFAITGTLAPGEYRQIYLDDTLRLSSAGETVYLTNAEGWIEDWLEYDKLDAGASYSIVGGAGTTELSPTPGKANSEASVREIFQGGDVPLTENATGVYINEICAASTYEDWIELWNSTGEDIDISGWGLSDDKYSPGKWLFPENTTLRAGEYAVICALGKGEADYTLENVYYTGAFAIKLTGGETVTLSDASGNVIDMLPADGLSKNISLGRAEGQSCYRYFTEQTPGAKNAAVSYRMRAATPQFGRTEVFCDSAFTLELTTGEGMEIYYTLDGSTPDETGTRYTAPIEISSSKTVRAAAVGEDMLASELTAHTYIFGGETKLRIVAISGERSGLNGSGGVLNTGYRTAQQVWVEIYDYDGSLMASQQTRLRTSGHQTRVNNTQKSFTLSSDKTMGAPKFKCALFRDLEYAEYDSITMRSSGQDYMQTHMRDSILTSLAADTSVLYQETEVCAVYVNGQYWGIYNMRENINADFIRRHEDAEDDAALDYIREDGLQAVEGSNADYYALLKKIKGNLGSAEALAALEGYVDVQNYLEYVALQMYIANLDLDNVALYRLSGGVWKWIFYDTDLSYQTDNNSAALWLSAEGAGRITYQDNTLFRELMKNTAARERFLTIMGELLATTCSPQNVVGLIYERCELIEDDMAAQCARWDYSVSRWQKYVGNMISFAETRPAKLIGYLESTFDLTGAEMEQYFGEALAVIEAYERPAR